MTANGSLVLDSYRLAGYTDKLTCYVCDGPNTNNAQQCRHCFAPMALSHQALGQKIQPQMVAVLGGSGVGKTVYLGMLMDMLSRSHAGLHVLARGAFSITLQQNTTSSLTQCEFPAKTPNEPDQWNWMHCVVQKKSRRGKSSELIMPDMAGEAILEEIDHPDSYPQIRELLKKCAGAVVLLDAISLEDGHREQEHFAMKLFSFLHELDANPKTGWANRPISVIFSKADQSETCLERPEHFAREHTPGSWATSQERFNKVRFFASGVAGACAFATELNGLRRRVPLRVEPRGVVEPFAWLVSELGIGRWRS